MKKVAARVRKILADGPLHQAEVAARLSAAGIPSIGWASAGSWVDLVRVPPSGTWEQRRADLYGLAERWLGPSSATEAEGLAHLVRRYLGGFGPASPNGIAGWAGVPAPTVRQVVDRLPLRRFRDDRGGELFDLKRAPLPDGDAPAPVRFLPTWDATLLVHARRTQVLPAPYRPLVFSTKTPHSIGTFLVDGSVAGTWRYAKGRVTVMPFDGPLPRAVRRELEDEAARLAAFHAD